MSAIFHITQANGASPTYKDVGNGIAANYEFNFMSTDDNEINVDYNNYPIVAGYNSFEVWILMRFGDAAGAFNTINNCKFWTNTPCYASGTGISVYSNINAANPGGTVLGSFATPVSGVSSVALYNITTGLAAPVSENVYIGTVSGGSITTPASFTNNASTNSTNFIVLQVQTTSGTSAGTTSDMIWHYSYDEA